MRVAVVIPFYQRDSGLLARALHSVGASKGHGASLDIIVVNDGSPASVEPEIATVAPELRALIRVVQRDNGGPAKARNSGLEVVADDIDVIAFQDSDDAWRPSHLARGVHAIAQGADFYFANAQMIDGTDWFTAHGLSSLGEPSRPSQPSGQYEWTSDRTLAVLSATYLSPTPTVLYRWDRHRRIRFDERLHGAGEDHLFWLDLAANSRRCVFSSEVEVDIGRGLNTHLSVASWSHPDAARVHLAQLLFYGIALRRHHSRLKETFPAHAQRLRTERARYRRLTMRLLLSGAVRGVHVPVPLLARLLRHDPVGLLAAPAAIRDVLLRRADPPSPIPDLAAHALLNNP